MVSITFIEPSGDEQKIDADTGDSVMRVALNADIQGITADCMGDLSCATCHVYVRPDWLARLAPPSKAEAMMLELAVEPGPTSRLCCQIEVTDDLDGLVVTVPQSQY